MSGQELKSRYQRKNGTARTFESPLPECSVVQSISDVSKTLNMRTQEVFLAMTHADFDAALERLRRLGERRGLGDFRDFLDLGLTPSETYYRDQGLVGKMLLARVFVADYVTETCVFVAGRLQGMAPQGSDPLLPRPQKVTDLTSGPVARRVAVLGGLLRGDSDKTIMADTGMAMSTVRVHVDALMRMFNAQSRTQMVMAILLKRQAAHAPVRALQHEPKDNGIARV